MSTENTRLPAKSLLCVSLSINMMSIIIQDFSKTKGKNMVLVRSGYKASSPIDYRKAQQTLTLLACLSRCGTETEGHKKPTLTGESFWMRSWATCTKFLSSCMCFWKRLLSSSSSRSKSLAASSKAWMRPFQERSAGT